MQRSLIFFLTLVLTGVASARSYVITVDTSTLAGKRGSFEFQLNPGPGTHDSGDVVIRFHDVVQEPNATVSGDVGFAPTFRIGNGQRFNSFFARGLFGNSMKVEVVFGGKMVTDPTPGRIAGTDFTFSIYADAEGTAPALLRSAEAGNALVTLSFDPVAGLVVSNNSDQARVEQVP